jgi:hypothetical protein
MWDGGLKSEKDSGFYTQLGMKRDYSIIFSKIGEALFEPI